MLRKERVWRTLSELCHRKISATELSSENRVGFTTLELAEVLALDRANTSRDLNQLVEEGRVVKLSGKPVLYLDRVFLEEKLGVALKQTCFNNLGALQAGHFQLQAVNSSRKADPSADYLENFSSQTSARRAVRWLDLPEDSDSQNSSNGRLSHYPEGASPALAFSEHFALSGLKPPQTYRLGIVVVAHGHTTASSMTAAARALASSLGECAAGLTLDVELEAGYDWVLEQVEALVKKSAASNPDGVLLLVDLPRLTALDSAIKQRTGLKLQAVENVNTAMLVEALRYANNGPYSLEEICHRLSKHATNFE